MKNLFRRRNLINPDEIFDRMTAPTTLDKERIIEALNFADKAHAGQTRFSGEPYIIHPFEVAKILAEMKVTTDMIIAGLIHDTLEDTPVTAEEIKKNFRSKYFVFSSKE